MITVKEVRFSHSGDTVVAVDTSEKMSYLDEQRLRDLLDKFYATPREFSRLAMEVTGTTILFRLIHNRKRSPEHGDLKVILTAMGLSRKVQPVLFKRQRVIKPITTKQSTKELSRARKRVPATHVTATA